ncbi:MAG TPA: GTP pyrophosphokinase family protein [Acholeplasma sp.]|nr:GTP pyrophosphokinase family protein [Acholeplasma sp.]
MNSNGWQSFLLPYELAVEGFIVKLESIRKQYILKGLYNPIEIVTGRVKTVEAILQKAARLNVEYSDIPKKIQDIAGVRVICKYIDDIYLVKELIVSRRDLKIITIKDYVKRPKPSGYRSLHIIAQYVTETIEGPNVIFIEFQIRTHVMHFWASIEHSLNYKYDYQIPSTITFRLLKASSAAQKLDVEMTKIKKSIDKLEEKHELKRAKNPLEEKEIKLNSVRKE